MTTDDDEPEPLQSPNLPVDRDADDATDFPEAPDVTTVSGQGEENSAAESLQASVPATAASLLAAILASMNGLGDGSSNSRRDRASSVTAPTGPSAASREVFEVANPTSVTPTSVVPASAAPTSAAVDVAAITPADPAGPPISIPIPGFHSLGQGTAPPPVEHANFAPAGSTRWYCVTRGIRVGVFGGW